MTPWNKITGPKITIRPTGDSSHFSDDSSWASYFACLKSFPPLLCSYLQKNVYGECRFCSNDSFVSSRNKEDIIFNGFVIGSRK